MKSADIKGSAGSPEELADLIDQLMSDGTGHVNILPSDKGEGFKIETVNSTDCGVKGACCQPTEDAVDDTED